VSAGFAVSESNRSGDTIADCECSCSREGRGSPLLEYRLRLSALTAESKPNCDLLESSMSGNKSIPSLSDIMIVGAELPEKIFKEPFKQYLFSDIDIGSSQEILDAIRAIVSRCDYIDAGIDVFSSWDKNYLMHLEPHMDWTDELIRVRRSFQGVGVDGGLTLLDPKHRWIAYQYFPMEVGVFAIDSALEFGLIKGVKDCFFSCNDLIRWGRRETQRDIKLVDDNFGFYVLTALIKNYC
jgi:hypothetical protein